MSLTSTHHFKQPDDISEKFYVILKGQVGLYFPKEFKQRYEDLKNSLSDEIYKYPVTEYKKLLKFIQFKEKDSWFGDIGLVNHSIMNQVAISESDVMLMIIDQKYYQRYIYEKEINFLKNKMKIFQSNLFSDCSISFQRVMYYMSSKQTYSLKQSVLSENEEIENIFIIKKGEFGVYKYIYDEDSMTNKMNDPLKQVTHPTDQFMRKKNIDNKKYSKNTKLKVIQKNDVVGEHDVIMRRKANYSCVCEGYEGGIAQAIPALIFLHVIEQDKLFHNSLKDKLKAKMIDFNDRVHKISSQMQKFGDFFFFKSRQKSEEQTFVKQGAVFEIDKQTKKITKIKVNENSKQKQGSIEEIKEIKQIVNKMYQVQDRDGEDHNDFTYFPFNNNVHQKIHYQNTLPISSKDVENEYLKSNNQLKKQKNNNNEEKLVKQNIPSQRQSLTNLPDSNQSFSMYKSQQLPQQKPVQKLKTQKSLQENIFTNKLQDNEIPRKYFSSQRAIPGLTNEESSNQLSNLECNNQQMQISQLSIDNQNNSRTSIDEQSEQKIQKSPIRSQSRRTIIINDKDLINEEEENHQSSSSSSSLSEKSLVSPISHKIEKNSQRNQSNAASILLEQDKPISLSPLSSKQMSPLVNEAQKGKFKRKQKKALTIQGDIFYDNKLLLTITKNTEESPDKKKNMYIDEDKPLQYFEDREGLSPDNKLRGRQTLSVYHSRKSESNLNFLQDDRKSSKNKLSCEQSLQSKRGSQSRIMDMVLDELQNGSSQTPKNMTGSSAFSNRNSNNLMNSASNASLNGKITDKFLQKAVENTQNLKNEILKERDIIQVSDLLSSNKNELKSLIEIKNLQKRMTQKQDPTKYDDLLKQTQMRVLDLNIKLSKQRNKSFLDEERSRQEKERNSINEEQKEQIIRRHISKIGLVSPTNSKSFSNQWQSNSLAQSFSQAESSQSGSISTGRNVLRQMQIRSMSNNPLSNESLVSPLNNSVLKGKEFERVASNKPSQFNIQASAAQGSTQNTEITNTHLFKNEEEMNSPIISVKHHQIREEEMYLSQRQGSSFFNYNDYAFSSPQHNGNSNRIQRRLAQQQKYIDPLNIGLKNNSTIFTNKNKIDHVHSYQDEESTNSPQTGKSKQKQGKKNKIHFKNSVDEYLELKAQALSNNFDKKKIKQKDLPFLDSYANQLQINLKRLFYLKLKENYCRETGFENVQQRVADQMLDKNFQQFLKTNKDILPEKKNLNYLYNWRKSESPRKSIIDKIQQQMQSPHSKSNYSNQNFLKGSIPIQGFVAKNIKLPNLYERKKQGADSCIQFQNQSQGQIQSSIILDRQNQSISKFDSTMGGNQSTNSKSNISNIFQNEGRDRIITERAKQFYENLQNIQELKKKQEKYLKTMKTTEFKQTSSTSQNFPTQAQFSTIANIGLLKKMSYKEFKDAYHDDVDKLNSMQDKARDDLINLDKFYKSNKKAQDVLKNDNLLIKKLSSKTEIFNESENNNTPTLQKLKRQSTFDCSKLEEDYLIQQQNGNNDKDHERVIEEDEEESPMKEAQRSIKMLTNQKSNSGPLSNQNLFTSPPRYRIQPKERGNSQKQLPNKTVEEEMKELTHSIILKYGLQSKFKNKKYK